MFPVWSHFYLFKTSFDWTTWTGFGNLPKIWIRASKKCADPYNYSITIVPDQVLDQRTQKNLLIHIMTNQLASRSRFETLDPLYDPGES